MTLTPRRPALRGTCQKAAESLVATDPSLTLVRGWYIDAVWGQQEHWWCTDAEGGIIDPTVEQFPTGHIESLREYLPYNGLHPCPGCGTPVRAEDGETGGGFCCGGCYGSTVGIYVGPCTC
jgi:hypothetical protein